jgi:hypothetical protein
MLYTIQRAIGYIQYILFKIPFHVTNEERYAEQELDKNALVRARNGLSPGRKASILTRMVSVLTRKLLSLDRITPFLTRKASILARIALILRRIKLFLIGINSLRARMPSFYRVLIMCRELY